MTEIYALIDPRNPAAVRYVGKTRRGVEKRRREHIAESMKDVDQGHRARWVRSLLRDGVEPEVVVLQVVEHEQEDEAERAWIRLYRDGGANLTNRTEGGEGLVDPTPDVVARIREAALAQWADPAARARLVAGVRSSQRWLAARRDPLALERKAEQMRRRWDDPDYRRRTVESITAARRNRPTATHCPQGHEYTPENSGTNVNGYRFCRVCGRAASTAAYRRRAAGLPAQGRVAKTHCVNGHEYTAETSRINAAGSRVCKVCRNASAERSRERRRARADD